ncbi:hypothetical protein F5Y08DRAFT_310881 [Xylaria arbuscula]|nr:hypothetical protein F5Y08DRAFT_310881 [Xylaria arbuscula]
MPTNTTDATTSRNFQSSRAWIAGPVIGAIAGAAILLIATWFMFRLIKKRNSPNGQELHGESALVSELDHKIKPQELHGKGENTHPVELPGSAFQAS